MVAYLGRRFIGFLAALVLVSLLVFLAVRVIPGDTAQIILGTDADPSSLFALRERLGLNEPLYVQYTTWIKNLLTGRLGESIRYGKPIGELIASRFTVTGPLALKPRGQTFILMAIISLLLMLAMNTFWAKPM